MTREVVTGTGNGWYALLALVASLAAVEMLQADDFRPVRVLGPQPAITGPPVIAAEQVRDQVTDNELVLGVVVEEQARAYPINMLTGPQREIINDTLGEVPIAATW